MILIKFLIQRAILVVVGLHGALKSLIEPQEEQITETGSESHQEGLKPTQASLLVGQMSDQVAGEETQPPLRQKSDYPVSVSSSQLYLDLPSRNGGFL